MKLPAFSYGQVQNLARGNVAGEAANAAAETARPFEQAQKLTGMAYENYDYYQLMEDQENALTEANKSTQVNSVLRGLKEGQVNLQQLPSGAVDAYRNSEGYDDSLHGMAEDGGEFAPSHKVAQSVYDWANEELKGSNDRLRSKRAQALYNENVGKDVAQAFEEAGAGIRSSQINALQLQTDTAVSGSNATGSLDKSLALLANGHNMGLYSNAEYNTRKKEAYKFKAALYNEDQVTLQNDIYNAAFQGNDALVKSLMNESVVSSSIVGKYDGLVVSPDEQNQYVRELNIKTYGGTVDGKAQDISTTTGISDSLTYVEAQERKLSQGDYEDLPQGMTVADAQQALSKSRARVQQRHNAMNAATKNLEGDLLNLSKSIAIEANINMNGGVLSPSGPAFKDYSEMYQTTRNQMIKDGVPREELAQKTLGAMNHAGQMPSTLKSLFDSVDRQTGPQQLDMIREFAYYRSNNPEIARQYDGANAAYLNMGADMLAFGDDESNSEAMVDQLKNTFITAPKDYDYNIQLAKDAGEMTPNKMADVREDVYGEVFESGMLMWKDNPKMGTQVGMAIDRMYKHERGKGADHDSAIKVVQGMIGNKIGKDTTDPRFPDGRTTLMPPEKIYGPMVVEQAKELKKKQFPDYNAEGIFFETDGLTMHQENPSYKVMYQDPANPNATPYQLTSWDKGGVDSGVIQGASGARWRPDPTDTQDYRDSQDAQAKQLSDGEFIKNQQVRLNDVYINELNKSGVDANSSKQEIQLAESDAYEMYNNALNSLKHNSRFTTTETVTNTGGRGGRSSTQTKSVFDKEAYKEAFNALVKAQRDSKAKWRIDMGIDKAKTESQYRTRQSKKSASKRNKVGI